MPAKTKPKAKGRRSASAACPNGRILTVKGLDKRSYDAIHGLKRGQRGPAMKALLAAAARYLSAQGDEHGIAALLEGRVQLTAV